MAKQKQKHVISNKTKRTIRKTSAAVLMASAIAVAAIPAGKIEAESRETNTGVLVIDDDRGSYTYLSYVDSDEKDDREYKDSQGGEGTYYLSLYSNMSVPKKLSKYHRNSEAEYDKSYYITPGNDGKLFYDWQFKYDGNVLCKYNKDFGVTRVYLPSFLYDKYYKISQNTYNNFFEKGSGSETLTYRYEDWVAEQDQPTGDGKIISSFFTNEYNSQVASWQAYWSELPEKIEAKKAEVDRLIDEVNEAKKNEASKETLAALNDELTAAEAALSDFQRYNMNRGTRPDVEKYASDFSKYTFDLIVEPRTISDLEAKRRYFCARFVPSKDAEPGSEESQLRPLSTYGDSLDFTLVEVFDRTTSSNAYFVRYLGDKELQWADLAEVGDMKFLVPRASEGQVINEINYIADYAFNEVRNVDELILNSRIKGIGDYAFSTSFLKKIVMPNVDTIGNAAFKNCTLLAEVYFSEEGGTNNGGLTSIGAEAFCGSGLKSIKLPYSVERIGAGAFANCSSMETVDLSEISSSGNGGCDIGEAVFYGAKSLKSILFPSGESNAVSALGRGALAVGSDGDSELSVELPEQMKSLPEYLFAGRTQLREVTMPAAMGADSSKPGIVPSTLFVGCRGLQKVIFPERAKYFKYTDKTVGEDADGNKMEVFTLFLDVDEENFVVKGPAYSSGKLPAYEREDTWYCITNRKNYVPYIYEENGEENYEISDGKYILTANEEGELLSCQVVGDGMIDLVIPKKVGNYVIKSIANGCFESDPKIKKRLRSLTIEDGTITAVQPGVFRDMTELKWVDLGNSVTSVGAEAFYGCKSLEDVTFRADYVTLGENAFAIGDTKLTFHGKIDKEFEPFVWATSGEQINGLGVGVCYKSLDASGLTVMYDTGTGLVTLLDYPKYGDLDRLHKQESIDYWYSFYSGAEYDGERQAFYNAWKTADEADEFERKSKLTALYGSNLYGPWVNPDFCNEVSDGTYRASVENRTAEMLSAGNTEKDNTQSVAAYLLDKALPAMKAHATSSADLYGEPIPYFEHIDHQYTIENKSPNGGSNPWDNYTKAESDWINACEHIYIPAGIESIDANAFYANPNNSANVYAYFSDTDTSMYRDKSKSGVIPGLFSGWHKDYDTTEDREKYEIYDKGNDRILSVTMSTVQYLPDRAFDSCERLEKVVLGEALSDIGELPFHGCTQLANVEGNEYYLTNNGLIVDLKNPGNDQYTLVECLPGRGNVVGNRTIPDDAGESEAAARISRIADYAFEDCTYVENVDLSSSLLETIPEGCFKNCGSNLNTVDLPVTTTSIKAEAFKGDERVTVSIPAREVFIATDAFEHGPNAKNDKGSGSVKFNTYPDSAAAEYADYYDIRVTNMAELHLVTFVDYNGNTLADIYVKDGESVSDDERPDPPTREGYEFEAWESNGEGDEKITVGAKIYRNVIFHPTYNAVGGTHDGKYFVVFYDGIDGSQLGDQQQVDPGTSVVPPEVPTHKNYKFLKWSSDEYTNVTKDLVITALFTPKKSSTGGSSGDSSGGSSGDGSGGSSGDSSGDKTDTSDKKKYNVTVKNGTGSGSYEQDATVAIVANTPESGKVFSKWTTEDKEVTFVNAAMSATTFKMPAKDVTVTAEYVDSAATATAVASPTTASSGTYYPPGYGTGSGSNTENSGNNNNAQVVVSKPGVSNIDLATAKVNGSSDSFVVKVTETNEAEEKVRSALTNRYGSIENRIKYWACDISLYDSTGNTRITDTTGLTVDITLPVPDDLRTYGGNNMVGAVADNTLESLTPRFNEINGVPCVTFTATHFSPYTIYADTENLSASQMLDATPKTGDPIHPKWFLSIGLAAVSILLFIKKDKKKNNVLQTA